MSVISMEPRKYNSAFLAFVFKRRIPHTKPEISYMFSFLKSSEPTVVTTMQMVMVIVQMAEMETTHTMEVKREGMTMVVMRGEFPTRMVPVGRTGIRSSRSISLTVVLMIICGSGIWRYPVTRLTLLKTVNVHSQINF